MVRWCTCIDALFFNEHKHGGVVWFNNIKYEIKNDNSEYIIATLLITWLIEFVVYMYCIAHDSKVLHAFLFKQNACNLDVLCRFTGWLLNRHVFYATDKESVHVLDTVHTVPLESVRKHMLFDNVWIYLPVSPGTRTCSNRILLVLDKCIPNVSVNSTASLDVDHTCWYKKPIGSDNSLQDVVERMIAWLSCHTGWYKIPVGSDNSLANVRASNLARHLCDTVDKK